MPPPAGCPIERLDTEPIPYEMQLLHLRIPKREGEHAVQLRKSLRDPMMGDVFQKDFRITMGSQVVTIRP